MISHHSLALGPHPQRELTLMPRLGFPCPRLGTPPQRGCRAGDPGIDAGAPLALGSYSQCELTPMHRCGFA